MKTDKVVKKLEAGAKNNTKCWCFSCGIRSFPTVFSNYSTNPTVFSLEFVVSLVLKNTSEQINELYLVWQVFRKM
jgi:hypothetical protein